MRSSITRRMRRHSQHTCPGIFILHVPSSRRRSPWGRMTLLQRTCLSVSKISTPTPSPPTGMDPSLLPAN